MRNALLLGESPIASHLLYTQRGVLDDLKPDERRLGIGAGHAWLDAADAMVVYVDRGVSPGMRAAVELGRKHPGLTVEFRSIENSAMGHALRQAADYAASIRAGANVGDLVLEGDARYFESTRWQGAVATARPLTGFSARMVR